MTDELKEFEVPQEQPSFQVPEKFQGKSMEDVVKSYTELEKALGKQSKEIGDLRKLADDLIAQNLEHKQPAPEPVNFLDDPDKYVNNSINANPKLKELEQATALIKKNETLSRLEKKYGDLETILKDEEFQEWIQKSKVRSELFVRADTRFDFDAADELLETWTDRQKIARTREVEEEQDRKREGELSALSASKGNGGSADISTNGKIYRRSDIRRLQTTDPKRYQQLLPEIRQAYVEGRVR